MMEQKKLMGCPCFNVKSKEDVSAFLLGKIKEGTGGYTAAINALKIVSYNENPETKRVIDNSLIQTPDGFGAQLAYRLKQGEKVMKLDLPGLAMEMAMEHKVNIFFLGTTEENNSAAVEKAKEIYPGIPIVGRMNGFIKDINDLVEALETAKPQIVMISMGSPRQEILSAELNKKFPNIIFVGSGGRMDILAGKLKRAPEWMQNNGLEWFYRFCQEPKRMFKGQVIGGLKFMKLLLIKS